jgi:threonyl-tRNA synthetase
MFTRMELDDAEYQLKPMNCPFHILIYKDSQRSYRDLPVRLGELGTVYRYERSGTLQRTVPRARLHAGRRAHLLHARADRGRSHRMPAVRHRHAEDLRLRPLQGRAFHLGWRRERQVRRLADQWALAKTRCNAPPSGSDSKVKVVPDEAAFYGPKIDVKLVDAIGRPWQLSTVQFDFNLPRRFELEYIGEDGRSTSR